MLKAADPLGDDASQSGSSDYGDDESFDDFGGCEGTGPIISSKYPADAIRVIEKHMDEAGIRKRCTRIAILSVIAKESHLVPKSERCYDTTPNSRIRNIWGRFKSWSDEDIDTLKADCELFFNTVYANRIGNGDVESGDGYKFRGRGLNQITGRANYRRYGYESNPEALNNLDAAADAAVQFVARGLTKLKGSVDPDFTNLDDAIKAVANVNAGLGHTEISQNSPLGRAIRTTTVASSYFV